MCTRQNSPSSSLNWSTSSLSSYEITSSCSGFTVSYVTPFAIPHLFCSDWLSKYRHWHMTHPFLRESLSTLTYWRPAHLSGMASKKCERAFIWKGKNSSGLQRLEVMKLFREGLSFGEISPKCGMSKPGCFEIVKRAIELRNRCVLGREKAVREQIAPEFHFRGTIKILKDCYTVKLNSTTEDSILMNTSKNIVTTSGILLILLFMK